MTGYLLHALPERQFLVALDPTFFQAKDPELYAVWYAATRKPPPGVAHSSASGSVRATWLASTIPSSSHSTRNSRPRPAFARFSSRTTGTCTTWVLHDETRGDQTGARRHRSQALALGCRVFLIAGTAFVYARVIGHPFILFDDNRYVSENPVVQQGLTWEGIRWAWTTMHVANWHPLTWLSHMTDVSLFGLEPAGHHAVNCSSMRSTQRCSFSSWCA